MTEAFDVVFSIFIGFRHVRHMCSTASSSSSSSSGEIFRNI